MDDPLGSGFMKTLGTAILATTMIFLFCILAFSAQADIENGKKVYAKHKCKLCHSIDGVGNKKSPLDGVGSKLNVEDMTTWIVDPKKMLATTKMKAYPNLPNKDLEDLVAYMMSLK
jgi:cytochrome c2